MAAERKGPFQLKTIPQGAATSVWTVVVGPADEVGGQHCENGHVRKIVPDDVTITAVSEGVRSYALDPKNAEALWKKSEEWSENRSNSLDERPEEISSTLRKALAMQDPVIVGVPVDYRDNSQHIRDT